MFKQRKIKKMIDAGWSLVKVSNSFFYFHKNNTTVSMLIMNDATAASILTYAAKKNAVR